MRIRSSSWLVVSLLLCAPKLAAAQYQFERAFGQPPAIGEPINVAVDRAGTIFVADRSNAKVLAISPQGRMTTAMTSAQGLKRPTALAIRPTGEFLVADETEGGTVHRFARALAAANRTMLKVAPEGVAAGQSAPGGVAADAQGNVWVSDQFRNTLSLYSKAGQLIKSFGKRGNAPGEFQSPRGVAVDGEGNVYVADEANNRIQKFDKDGTFVAQSDAKSLGGTVASGLGPMSVAIDSKGYIWVAAHTNFAVYKLDPKFHIVVRLDTFGRRDGELAGPVSVAVDAKDNVVVLDRSRRVQRFSPTGNFLWKYEFPPAKLGELSAPTGVRVDGEGNVYVSDTANFRIQKFSGDGRPLLTFGQFGHGDGEFNGAESMAIDRTGNLWIVDSYNHRVQKFSPDGKFLMKVGSFGRGNGEFLRTKVVDVDNKRDWVYVNDWHNARVQKFDLNGTFITAFGDVGDFKKRVGGPTGLAIDADGNVYVSSWFNNAIQKFDSNGNHLATLGGPGTGDGQFRGPARLAMNRDGNLVVVDWGNNRVQVLDRNGRFVTKFGTPGRGNGSFDQPVGVSVDAAGNVFVSDAANSRVQKFKVAGHTEVGPSPTPATGPTGASQAGRPVFVTVALYDVEPGRAAAFEAALARSRGMLQGQPAFVNERVLKNIDGLTLQYATYTKFSERAPALRTVRRRMDESLRAFCRREPEVHVTQQTDAYSPDQVTATPTGREFGEGKRGQIAHIGLFIPLPHYASQYFGVLHETKELTRDRKPTGYLGEDLLVELDPPAPAAQTPYSPHPLEVSPMSINYGEYETMENAEDSYITRQVVRDQKLVTMERTFFSSLQVPTRFYIFQVIDNYGRTTHASRVN